MQFCEYIYRRLKTLNYDYVFGVPGSYIMNLWQSFKGEPKIILARHESGAAYMADGWSRYSGKAGVVLSTIGPGITNVITGVACAYKDSIPMLVITGQANCDTFGTGVFQESYQTDRGFNPISLMSNVTKASFEVTNIKNAVSLFEKALKIANTGRKGPVHLSLPFDIQTQEINSSPEDFTQLNLIDSKNLLQSKTNSFDFIKNKLLNSKKTLIIAGWGCHLSGCSEEIKKLSYNLSAPILSTIKGLTSISYNWDLYLGHLGASSKKAVIDFISGYSPDTVLILGASLSSSYATSINNVLNNAYTIQVDISEEQIGFYHNVNYGIQSDIKTLLEYLNIDHIKNNDEFIKQHEEIKILKSMIHSDNFLDNYSNLGLMSKSINHLNHILPQNTTVIPDAGNHWLDTLSLFRAKEPLGLCTNAGLGAMGHAIGASIGIKLAMQDRRVICISGDGSMLMSGNEISVSSELGLDNIYIVYNNLSLARVRTYQKMLCNENYISSDIGEFNFKKWAEGLGVKSYRAFSLDEFKNSILEALKSKSTSLIEVMVDKNEIPICFL